MGPKLSHSGLLDSDLGVLKPSPSDRLKKLQNKDLDLGVVNQDSQGLGLKTRKFLMVGLD